MTTRRAFKQLSDLMRQAPRTLVPVLGSGFVTQAVLVGASTSAAPSGASPTPVDWVALLNGVAAEFECEAAIRHIHADVPGQTTLLWDAMVADLARRAGARSRGAHVWEGRMRRSVARRLREDVATRDLARPFVESFLRLGWDDVLTFNFDSVLLPRGAVPKPRLRGEASRAALGADVRTDSGSTRVWYPHGHLSDEASIVLGAHAYGVRIAAMQAAFDAHALRKRPRPSRELPSWVATVLERPLLFVGLSLTREEWTIWWLLSQRARFLARREGPRPAAFVFARRPASAEKLEAHASFQTLARACDLLGLTLLSFDDFKLGWRDLRQAVGW